MTPAPREPRAETMFNPHANEWQARIERGGRLYLGVGRTEQEAVQAAERKAGQ